MLTALALIAAFTAGMFVEKYTRRYILRLMGRRDPSHAEIMNALRNRREQQRREFARLNGRGQTAAPRRRDERPVS